MSATREIPTQDTTDLSTFRILVDKEEVSGKYSVSSIVVHKCVNKIPTAKLVLLDGDVSKQDFETSSSGTFNPGKEVTIKLGYHSKEDVVFTGVIVRHGIKLGGKKSSYLTLELKDKSVKMTIARKNKYFADVTDSDVMEQLISGAGGLDKDVTSTSAQHPEMIQYYCSDWDFLLSRADVNGMLVFVDDGKITVKAPAIASPLVTLAYGANIYEFEAEMDARDQYSSVSSSAWDPSQQAIVSEDGSATFTDAGEMTTDDLAAVLSADYKMQHTGKISSAELTQWANAKLLRSKLAKIQGRVKITGFSDIKPGDTIALEEFGKNFNGKVFVSEVMHQFSADTAWYTDIQFGMSQEWFAHKYQDVIEKPASGLLPGIFGLQIATVTQIEDDPDSEFRVKIRIPIISPDDEGSWARIATLDAGNARGSFFRPEVDDEVVVGFLNDDPRSPIILGMLHSSSLAAPLTPTSDNFQKGFFTRENLQLLFDDDKKSISLITPGGNSIVIDDDKKSIVLTDQNNNKVELSDKGIILESGKDISLKAAQGDIKLEAMNVTLKADVQFKATGDAGVEMSSSAQAVLKGGIVQIN
jgi:Rhs element Vgr protein